MNGAWKTLPERPKPATAVRMGRVESLLMVPRLPAGHAPGRLSGRASTNEAGAARMIPGAPASAVLLVSAWCLSELALLPADDAPVRGLEQGCTVVGQARAGEVDLRAVHDHAHG